MEALALAAPLVTELRALVGIVALMLGVGVALRSRGRRNAQLLAALLVAIATWTLGQLLATLAERPLRDYELLYLLGACLAAALALHLALRLGHPRERVRSIVIVSGYAAAALLILAVALGMRESSRGTWNALATVFVGATLLGGVLLLRRASTAPAGLSRGAHWILLGSAVLAGVGGLSDFVPRETSDIPRLGVLAIVPFLLVLLAIIERGPLPGAELRGVRIASSCLLAGLCASLILTVTARFGHRFTTYFVPVLLVLLAQRPARRLIGAGSRLLGRPTGLLLPLVDDVARRSPRVQTRDDVDRILAEIDRRLAGRGRLELELLVEGWDRRRGADGTPEPPNEVLRAWLEQRTEPIHRRFLEADAADARDEERQRLIAIVDELHALGLEAVVPLQRGPELVGWIGLAGEPASELGPREATALAAIGLQLVAVLERLGSEEQARRAEALAAVGQVAAGLAHEIRNPLGALHGAAQVLAGETDEQGRTEMLEVIEEESGRLGRVVGEFLDYARPGQARRGPVDLVELCQGVLRQAELAGLGMRHELDIAEEARWTTGDPDQLHRVLANLVRNAREAAGADGTLVVTGRAAGVTPPRLVLRFQDDGPGIPDDEVGRVLAPFHSGRPGGTGLGLALVEKVVLDHEGRVEIEGRPGRGAAISLVLPRTLDHADPGDAEGEGPVASSSPGEDSCLDP
ncbi:MAG: ATP-binding protein [Acidobacteriota bacterium]